MLRTVCVAFISLNVFVSIWAVALPEGKRNMKELRKYSEAQEMT